MLSEAKPLAIKYWICLNRNNLLSYPEMDLHPRAVVLGVGSQVGGLWIDPLGRSLGSS